MRDWASTIRRLMPIIDVLLILLFFFPFALAPPARIQAEFAVVRRERGA